MPPQVRLRIEVDGEVVVDMDEPVLMVAIGNGTSVGGGAELTPEADPEDGLVDVMISRSVGPFAKFGYAVGVARGRHHERDDVRYLRASRGHRLGRELLLRGRRRDLRAGAAPQLAGRAVGVLHGPAVGAHSQPRRAASTPGLEAGLHAELGHDRRDPATHRAQADAERARDLLVLRPLRELVEEEAAAARAARPARRPGRAAGWPAPTTPRTTARGRGRGRAAGPATAARRRTPAARAGRHGWRR